MRPKAIIITSCSALAGASICWGQQPLIVRQPADQSVSLGANVSFRISAATTNPPLTFQWRFEGADLSAKTNFLLTLPNVQLTNVGGYDVVARDLSGSITSRVAMLDVDPTFTKITTGHIVTNVGTATGCAWGDYDNDGYIDLILTSAFNPANNTAQKNILYHNERDGSFKRITNSVIGSEARDWRGCSWVDYDNDGYLDLYATSTDANAFAAQNELFRNNGDGTFTKMTTNVVGPIASLAAGGSEGPVWADYDRDGTVDMYMARYGADWMFHNTGDGSFTKLTNGPTATIQARGDSYNAFWGDYDNDGWPDLFIPVKDDNNRNQTNILHHNDAGVFTRITSAPFGTDNEHSIGCAWGDYDNDGLLDLFVVNGQTNCSLYHNSGNGTFSKMTAEEVGSIVSDKADSAQCAWGDYDNDGYLDLLVTVLNSAAVNFLYHNNGDGTFARVTRGSPANDVGVSVGCAWGDYDNDGFLDLFVARGTDALATPNLLYRNNGNSNWWMMIKLIGTVSNRSAIGAKVRVKSTIGGKSFWQLREINTGDGFSGNQLDAHFGLGDATNMDLVRIEWPSGIEQTMTNVASKQFLTVVEHQDLPASPPSITNVSIGTDSTVDLSATGDTGLRYLFEGSTNLVNWSWLGVRTNVSGGMQFTDRWGTNLSRRFYRVSIP